MYIINEIYQRGLFNKLITALSTSLELEKDRKIVNLWIKLAGKVCIN